MRVARVADRSDPVAQRAYPLGHQENPSKLGRKVLTPALDTWDGDLAFFRMKKVGKLL